MGSKVSVLHIVGNPAGGIRKHIHDIIFGLTDDIDFYYISSKEGDKTFFKEMPKVLQCSSGYKSLKINKKPHYTDIINIIKICLFINKHGIQILHGHGAKGGLYSRICGILMGCKVIYTPHGGVVHNMFGKYEDMLYKAIERMLFPLTDTFIFESNYTKNAFNKKIGATIKKGVVNYNGVSNFSRNKKYHKLKPLKIKLGVFGALRDVKGQDIALLSIVTLLEKNYDLELNFFGDGPMRAELEEKANSLNLTGNVIFHGEVDDISPYLQQVDFVIIPSRFESFGYVAVEAMLSKKPIVCTNVGGLMEVLSKEIAFFCDEPTHLSLAQTLELAFKSSPEMIVHKVDLGYERANDLFNLDKMLLRLKHIYANTLK